MIIQIEELRNYKKERDYVNSKLLQEFALCEEKGIPFSQESFEEVKEFYKKYYSEQNE